MAGLTRMLIELLEAKPENVRDGTFMNISCYQELLTLIKLPYVESSMLNGSWVGTTIYGTPAAAGVPYIAN